MRATGITDYLKSDGTLEHAQTMAALSSPRTTRRYKTLLPMIQRNPDDRNLPNFLTQVKSIFAWHTTVPVENRFSKE